MMLTPPLRADSPDPIAPAGPRGMALELSAALLEATSDAVIGVNEAECIVLVNRAAEKMFGYSREELLGTELDLLVPPASAEAHHRLFRAFVGSGASHRAIDERQPVLAQRRDGSRFSAEFSITRLEMPGLGVVIAAFLRDVSDRVEAERAMRESERRFRDTFEQAAVGMAHLSLEGRFIRVNGRLAAMLGTTPDALLGHTFADFTFPEDRAQSLRAWDEFFRRGQMASTQRRYAGPGGAPIWTQLTATLIKDEEGRPEHVFTILEDITGRKRVADEHARMASIVQHASAAIVGSDLDHMVISWNPAAESLYGYTAEEAMGRHGRFLLPGGKQESATAVWARVHTGEPLNDYETERAKKSGELVPVSQSLFPLRNASGEIDGWATFAYDITARKAAEREARTARELLQATLDALTTQVAVVDDEGVIIMVNRAWTEFAAVAQGETPARAVGNSYAAACGARPPVDIAPLLSGEVDRISRVYRCELPGEERWFLVNGTPLEGVAGARAVLAHDDVTELRAMRRELDEAASAFTSSINAMAIASLDGRLTYVNRAFVSLWGYGSEAEAHGYSLSDLWQDEGDAARLLEHVSRNGSFSGELRTHRMDGEALDTHVAASLIQGDDTHATGLMLSFIDVTERNRMERELRRSERSLAAAQRIASLGHWDWDITTGSLAWSDEIYRIFGLQPQQFAATYDAFLERVHPQDRALVQAGVDRALRGEPYAIDHRVLRPDGTIRIVHETGEVTFVDGLPVRMLGACQDVTRVRRTQEVLAQSEASLRALFDGAGEAIFLLDRDSRVLSFNHAASALTLRLGGPNLERGARISDVLPRELSQDFGAQSGATASRGILELSRQLQIADGSPCWVEASYSPVELASGEIAGVALIIRDTTERRRVEEQLIQAQKMESIGRLAGGVAHDFNNLLTAILGYTHLARSTTPEEDPRADDLREIASAAERASALTRQLLTFARQQLGEPKTVELGALLEGMHRLLGRLIGEHIEIVTRQLSGPLHVHIDPAQLEQVVVNLAINARDAMPGGGTLTIRLERTRLPGDDEGGLPAGEYARLSVSDTGDGIPAGIVDRIFEPFFTTKEVGHGTGLGLATSFGIVQAAGGSIAVVDEPGASTTFAVLLPLITAEPQQPSAPLSNGRPSRGDGLILLVEDEPQVRAIARRILRSLGYQVAEAANGAAALELLDIDQLAPDLLLTDIVMPQMSGWELAEQVRERRPAVGVVYMSGYSQDMDRFERDESAAFVAKPFSVETLSTAVRAAMLRMRR